jgi:hypothetical protein
LTEKTLNFRKERIILKEEDGIFHNISHASILGFDNKIRDIQYDLEEILTISKEYIIIFQIIIRQMMLKNEVETYPPEGILLEHLLPIQNFTSSFSDNVKNEFKDLIERFSSELEQLMQENQHYNLHFLAIIKEIR